MRVSLDDPKAVFTLLLRNDFGAFLHKAVPYIAGGADLLWNWHLDAIAYELDRIRSGESTRLIVNLPPRNLKSIAVSIAWVAWMLGQDPTLNFVCVSYSGELAGKLARDCRAIMQSVWYRELFPRTIISAKRSATHDFETTAGGGRLATSPTGTLTGRGGDIVIIDDPIKPDEVLSETTRKSVNEWFSSTLASRLNDKSKGSIIVVMQRLHEADLCGVQLEKGGWSHLSLPAIATADDTIPLTRGRFYFRKEGELLHPARENQAALDKSKADMGSILFSAQYQQNPVPATGNMAKADWLIHMDNIEAVTGGIIVQSWDTASKDGIHNDWSVCVTARVVGHKVYLLDVFRKRMDFHDLRREAIRLARFYRPQTLLIEDAASGMQLYQALSREEPAGVPRPLARRVDHDKVTRFGAATAMIEAQQLVLPKEASWLATFKSEILAFPNGRHDDQADALSQLLIWVRNRRDDLPNPEGAFIPPPDPVGFDDDVDDGPEDYLLSDEDRAFRDLLEAEFPQV